MVTMLVLYLVCETAAGADITPTATFPLNPKEQSLAAEAGIEIARHPSRLVLHHRSERTGSVPLFEEIFSDVQCRQDSYGQCRLFRDLGVD